MNSGQLRLKHWLSDAPTTWPDLIHIKTAIYLSLCLHEDVQPTGEVCNHQTRTSSTSKHEISYLPSFYINTCSRDFKTIYITIFHKRKTKSHLLGTIADPGCLSRIRLFSIPDPNCFHPGSASKNLSILSFFPKKMVSKL